MTVIDFRNDRRIFESDREVLREHCGELRDPVVLAVKLGLKVIQKALPWHEDGYIVYDESVGSASGYVVVVNQNHPVSRQQFTIAHEIGHYVLHRNTPHFRANREAALIAKSRGKVVPFRSANRTAARRWAGVDFPECFEREADVFAALVLLPPGATRRSSEFVSGEPCALAERLELSKSFVVRRFGELLDSAD